MRATCDSATPIKPSTNILWKNIMTVNFFKTLTYNRQHIKYLRMYLRNTALVKEIYYLLLSFLQYN